MRDTNLREPFADAIGIKAIEMGHLPIAVTISLIAFLFVAIFLTPLLCSLFIKTGLHSKKKKRISFLDILQGGMRGV
ncbi:MAG: hypothetical protein KKC20_12620 [Proteobacteria bacterium]|nr:hypothetical protein [Pseudomonadota bacterium]